MISVADLIKVGYTQKPYSIRGELNVMFDKPAYADIDTEYYFMMMDSIPVPFFIDEFTYTSEHSARIKFEDVNDEVEASRYASTELFLFCNEVISQQSAAEDDMDMLVGYAVIDQHDNRIGTIEAIDTSTINVLFVVMDGTTEKLIPATADFVVSVQHNTKTIVMNLPEGLFDE